MEHDFIKSKKQIKDILPCQNCPFILTHKDNYVLFGNGTITANTVFVIPYHDINNNKNTNYDLVQMLKDAYQNSHNVPIEENCYITALPKCFNKKLNKYEANEVAKNICIDLLIAEIRYYCKYCTKIVICDRMLFDCIEDKLNNTFPDIKTQYIPNPKQYIIDPDKYVEHLNKVLND